jgi:hypothetical protein
MQADEAAEQQRLVPRLPAMARRRFAGASDRTGVHAIDSVTEILRPH